MNPHLDLASNGISSSLSELSTISLLPSVSAVLSLHACSAMPCRPASFIVAGSATLTLSHQRLFQRSKFRCLRLNPPSHLLQQDFFGSRGCRHVVRHVDFGFLDFHLVLYLTGRSNTACGFHKTSSSLAFMIFDVFEGMIWAGGI